MSTAHHDPDANEKGLKDQICEALLRLQKYAYPEIQRPAHFAKLCGLSPATVQAVVDRRFLPGVETIAKWVRACNSDLSQFFHDMTGLGATDVSIKLSNTVEHVCTELILTSNHAGHANGLRAHIAAAAHDLYPDHPDVQKLRDLVWRFEKSVRAPALVEPKREQTVTRNKGPTRGKHRQGGTGT
jgi:hypothetical protein